MQIEPYPQVFAGNIQTLSKSKQERTPEKCVKACCIKRKSQSKCCEGTEVQADFAKSESTTERKLKKWTRQVKEMTSVN